MSVGVVARLRAFLKAKAHRVDWTILARERILSENITIACAKRKKGGRTWEAEVGIDFSRLAKPFFAEQTLFTVKHNHTEKVRDIFYFRTLEEAVASVEAFFNPPEEGK